MTGIARTYVYQARERRSENVAAALNHHQVKWLNEVLGDAEKSGRLTDWERDFIYSLWDLFGRYGAATTISSAQWTILRRIEEKIHAAG